MTILITGSAGFVGFYIAKALLEQGKQVVGIDNLNDYYDPLLKQARLSQLKKWHNFEFHKLDITDLNAMETLFERYSQIEIIVHLAAQAGVRFSLQNPYAYIHTNIDGHLILLELARKLPKLKHFVFASSSSVYGLNSHLPFCETDPVNKPSSVYAVSKRSAELLSFTYSHLYGLKQTGLRLFTVYGPWGRPDMAYFAFARSIVEGKPITLYDGDSLARDFTYIDDIQDAILGILDSPPSSGETRILNVGNHRSESVRYLIELLENSIGKKAILDHKTRPSTDLEQTWAAVKAIQQVTGWEPKTRLSDGIPSFVSWYKNFYKLKAN